MKLFKKQKYILTIELVPEPIWYANLRKVLTTQQWDYLRRLAYRASDYKCSICGGKGPDHPVEAHEIFEYDDKRHVQTLKGMMALCPSCHQVKHIGLAQMHGKYDEALAQLMKVNDIDFREAKVYIQKCWEQWDERNRHKWTQNLGWLLLHKIDPPIQGKK
jgi:hypothetical protein